MNVTKKFMLENDSDFFFSIFLSDDMFVSHTKCHN